MFKILQKQINSLKKCKTMQSWRKSNYLKRKYEQKTGNLEKRKKKGDKNDFYCKGKINSEIISE